MPVPSSNRNVAPIGYLELRAAIASVRRRMFTSEIPVWLIEAARANLAEAANLAAHKNLRISVRPRMPAHPEPIKFVADAIASGRLTLFIFAENLQRVIPVPVNCTQEILDRLGFFCSTRETIGLRFMDFFPRRILVGLDFPGISMVQFDRFAVCLRESAFDSWLASTAHQQCWPLDAIPRSGRGRPRLVPIVKSIVKDLIDSGQWRQGMPLKALVVSIQPKIKDAKVDRETVKKAMDALYHETRQLKYRYARRERKVLAKRRTR
jgi:hypothetical protein